MTRMIVRTTDRDVVVPEVINAQKIHATEIWVPCGVWKNFNYIPAHQIFSQLGPRPASALPTFNAFPGCDTVSSFLFFFSFLPAKKREGHGKVGKRTQRPHNYAFLSLCRGPDLLVNTSKATRMLRRAFVRQNQPNDEG